MKRYAYIALDIYSGNYGTLTANKLYTNGEIVKGQWEIKEGGKKKEDDQRKK